ncbi:dolichol kinase [Halosimplex marinum]|uniref:dolichol kinase n=1 Tax=Halosimplex marinum TaxID=3396620 RepID=UPI003F56888C
MRDEILRRLVHASGTAVPLAYLFVPAVEWVHVQGLLVAGLAVAAVLEVVRLVVGLDWWVYEKLTREYEQDNLAGYFLAVFSMAAVALAFEPTIAVPAILMLTVADPVSGLLGSGELRAAKDVTVLLTTFAVATLLAVPFVPATAAVAGGVAATVADGIKPVVRGYVIDDNLTIPVAGAAAMFLAVEFLPSTPV